MVPVVEVPLGALAGGGDGPATPAVAANGEGEAHHKKQHARKLSAGDVLRWVRPACVHTIAGCMAFGGRAPPLPSRSHPTGAPRRPTRLELHLKRAAREGA